MMISDEALYLLYKKNSFKIAHPFAVSRFGFKNSFGMSSY